MGECSDSGQGCASQEGAGAEDVSCSSSKSALEKDHSLEESVGLGKKNGGGISLMTFLKSEVTRGYLPEENEEQYREKRARVSTFFIIPIELEKFMTYGFLQCVDAFLFTFTFLPIRVAVALLTLLTQPFVVFRNGAPSSGSILTPAQRCDLLKALLIIICYVFLYFMVDMSFVYHVLRGQTIIKLYIAFNMLEVGDRLLSSFGQDMMEAVLWTAAQPKERKRDNLSIFTYLVPACCYLLVHTLFILLQATTLSVAFNSHSRALLTIMMSNNFVELKGSVFKKFEKRNLFQMACSDVRERFHFDMLLLIVCIRNCSDYNWDPAHLLNLIPDVCIMIGTEFLVDWVKHAFITKFNDISPEVYREYTLSLAHDMIRGRQQNAFTDVSDMVSRRMGLLPIPLSCLLMRIIGQSVNIAGPLSLFSAVLAYFCLVTLKVGISICLLGRAVDLVKANQVPSTSSTTPRNQTTTPRPTPRKAAPPHKNKNKDDTTVPSVTAKTESTLEVPAREGEVVLRKKVLSTTPPITIPEDGPVADVDDELKADYHGDDPASEPLEKGCVRSRLLALSQNGQSDSNVHLDTLCIDEDLLRISNVFPTTTTCLRSHLQRLLRRFH